MPENTSSTAQATIDNGYSVITHQFPPTNYPTDYDPVTKVTECDYGTECPCIGASPSIPVGSDGQTIVISASEATTASAGIVKTCNTSTSQATSTTVSLVPTQYYVQGEVTRLEGLISSASSTTVISSSIVSSSTIVSNEAATLESAGIVTTCNTSNAQVTSETVAVVPTQYYVQSEIGRLEGLISSNSGGTQTVTPQAAWMPITDLGDSTTVTLEAGQNYKLRTSIGSQTITAVTSGYDMIGADTKLLFGVISLENLTVSYPLILKDELTPGALNVCTVKFVDARAYVFVDMCITDYTVTITTDITGDITNGSIYYGLTSAPMPNIGFAPATNGSACLLNGAIVRTDKVLTGNGMNNTIISGLMGCASGASCTMNSLTLQSADILEGSGTVIMSAARVQNVNNSGTMKLVGSETVINGSLCNMGELQLGASIVGGTGTIDMCNKQVTWLNTISCCDLTFKRGSAAKGGLGYIKNMGIVFSNCTFENNSATSGSVIEADYGGWLVFSNCTFSGNKGSKGLITTVNEGSMRMVSCYVGSNAINTGGIAHGAGRDYQMTFSDCHLTGGINLEGNNGYVTFLGSNYWTSGQVKMASSGHCRIAADSILDISDNTNATPISCGYGIIVGSSSDGTWVEGGTASVIISGGATVTISGSGTTLDSAGVLA